jgi:hypothetical protein
MAAAAPNRPLVDRHAGARRYFRRWTKAEKWKWLLTGVAGVIALGWLAAAPIAARLGRPNTDARYSHGPLANPHAAWEANCDVCHKPHTPADFPFNLFDARGRWQDLACETCHAGPAHNGPGISGHTIVGCADCHHDHQGRTASLTKLPDTNCTNCHAKERIRVSHFATGHPEFRALKEEAEGKSHTRTIKFSHALHMAPGVSLSPDPRNDRAALRNKWPVSSLKQLTCQSCHELDANLKDSDLGRWLESESKGQDWPRASVQPARSAGAVFLPINFEAHCRQCHPLGVAGEQKAGEKGIDIPHRKQPAELKELICAAAALDLGLGKIAATDQSLPFTRQQPERPAPTKADDARLDALSASRLTIVEANCRKCHDQQDGKISPVTIPTVWFESARFDHTAHRGAACQVCHPMPQIGSGKLDEREKINILGIETCRQCHAPAGGTRDAPTGGIRHGCTDCHTYHNGGHGLQGRGAAARVPADPKKSAVEFLLGKPPPAREKP